jgi:hypothetical protein
MCRIPPWILAALEAPLRAFARTWKRTGGWKCPPPVLAEPVHCGKEENRSHLSYRPRPPRACKNSAGIMKTISHPPPVPPADANPDRTAGADSAPSGPRPNTPPPTRPRGLADSTPRTTHLGSNRRGAHSRRGGFCPEQTKGKWRAALCISHGPRPRASLRALGVARRETKGADGAPLGPRSGGVRRSTPRA